MPPPDWDRVHADFPVNDHLIWLNNCGTTPLSGPVLASLREFQEDYARLGLMTKVRTYPAVQRSIQEKLSALLGGQPDEYALVHNTAEGMNLLSHGLTLAPGDEILLLENEYPSNVYPWEHWREKGVTLRFVPCGASPGEFLSALKSMAGPRTRVAALSAVHWCTGMPLPLEAAGMLLEKRCVEFVLDASQGAGLVPIDAPGYRIGYMAFSAWKWLLGPLGLGVMYIARGNMGKVKPIFKGAASVERDEEYLPYREGFKPSAERFTYSTANFNDWVWFEASLDYLAGLGFPAVMDRIAFLGRTLSGLLRDRGFAILSDAFPGFETGIVAASKPGLDAARAVRRLKGAGIIAAERLGRIRLSPHVYNSPAQLERAAAELSSL